MAQRTSVSDYLSPLAGYEDQEPLPMQKAEGKKYLENPQTGVLSKAYDRFPDPIRKPLAGFDVHIYYFQSSEKQTKYARELHERVRREFPELQVFTFWDRPLGPHPIAMFEVDLLNPTQFGAFVPWIAVNRGPLSVLVHPNTVEEGRNDHEVEVANHTTRAIWMGEKVPLDTDKL